MIFHEFVLLDLLELKSRNDSQYAQSKADSGRNLCPLTDDSKNYCTVIALIAFTGSNSRQI